MSRMSTRGEYQNLDILLDPAFIANLHDTRPKVQTYVLFTQWVDGSTIPEIADKYGLSATNVAHHLQRTKAIYNIFAGRDISKYWDEYGLKRIVAVRTELWRANRDMNGRQLALATLAFNEYFDGVKTDPKWLLAVSTEEGIERIPRAGAACTRIFRKAREQAVMDLLHSGELEKLEGLINLRTLLERAVKPFAWPQPIPVDLTMARLMDAGIYNEDQFYRDGWKRLYTPPELDWGMPTKVLWNAYQAAMSRRHPDIKNPLLVLFAMHPGKKSAKTAPIHRVMRGVDEQRIPEMVETLKRRGWQVAVGGNGRPARMIYIRKGE